MMIFLNSLYIINLLASVRWSVITKGQRNRGLKTKYVSLITIIFPALKTHMTQ